MTTCLPVELAHDGLPGCAGHDLAVTGLSGLVVEDLNGRGGHARGQQCQTVKLNSYNILLQEQ